MKTKTVLASVLSTALLGALSLGACDKADKKSETKADPAATGDQAGTTEADKPPEAEAAAGGAAAGAAAPVAGAPTASGALEILDEGAEPRFQLRYAAPAGTKQAMEMSMDITMDIPMMGKMVMPTMLMLADVTVENVAADGTMTNKMIFTGADVRDTKDSMPGAADMMKEQLANIKGMTTTMKIDPHGKVLEMNVDTSKLAPELKQTMGQTKQSLDQMVAQLPTKPVGKGAKWRVKQTVDQGGMKVDQTTVYELVEVAATTAKIKGVANLSAPKQEIDQGGMKVTLESLTGNAVTDMEIDFAKVVPKVDGTVDMKMKMNAMGQSADMAMVMKMGMRSK